MGRGFFFEFLLGASKGSLSRRIKYTPTAAQQMADKPVIRAVGVAGGEVYILYNDWLLGYLGQGESRFVVKLFRVYDGDNCPDAYSEMHRDIWDQAHSAVAKDVEPTLIRFKELWSHPPMFKKLIRVHVSGMTRERYSSGTNHCTFETDLHLQDGTAVRMGYHRKEDILEMCTKNGVPMPKYFIGGVRAPEYRTCIIDGVHYNLVPQ